MSLEDQLAEIKRDDAIARARELAHTNPMAAELIRILDLLSRAHP